MIHLYIGKGKGKTSAAIGLAIRAKGAKKRVCFIQFLKGGCVSSEIPLLEKLGIKVMRFKQSHPCFNKNVSVPVLKKTIAHDLGRVQSVLKSAKYDVVVIDEILSALFCEFINEEDVLEILKSTPEKAELVLTGLMSTKKIARKAQYISNITNIKHPYNKGKRARRGIEL